VPSQIRLLTRATVLGCAALLVLGADLTFAKTTSGPEAKLDSHLQRVVATEQSNGNAQGAGSDAGVQVDAKERALVDVYVRGPVGAAADALRAAGMTVTVATSKAPVPMVEGWLPVDLADAVAKLDVVRAVVPVMGSGSNAGSVQTEGDAAHRGGHARMILPGGGPTGAGVDVGVISTSYNRVGSGIAGSQNTGDLPFGISLLKDGPAGSNDEGRAMAEIMYDMAPNIPIMVFASGSGGPAEKADSINQLANRTEVIADDTFYLGEPFFQDGVVAQAVDAAHDKGVAYIVAAGNRARQAWTGTYRPSTAAPGYNNFSSSGDDSFQSIHTVPPGDFIEINFQWAEPWGRATTDLDVSLDNVANGASLASDTTANNITGIPSAYMFWRNTTTAPVQVEMRVRRFSGTNAPFMKYIARDMTGSAFTIDEYATNSSAVDPDAAMAKGAIAVAAVNWNDPGNNDPEAFSSRGNPFRLFDKDGNSIGLDVRRAPKVAGADAVYTTVPGFQPFFGTSAAAPHIAAIATLMKSARPAITVDEIYKALLNPDNSIDCWAAGKPDEDCGYGFLLADRAVYDATSPRATITPSSGASEVLPNGTVVVTYSLRMNKPSAEQNFSLVRASDGAAVGGSFTWFGDQALVFKPTTSLQPGTAYTARANSNAVSYQGVTQYANAQSTFTTTNRPIVESVSPKTNATGVARNTQIVVTFNKAMNKTSTGAAFALRRESNSAQVAGTVAWFGDRSLVFKPSAALAAQTRYRINVSGAGVRDTAGNVIANPMSSPFTTGN
jgi:hypothetical protein